MTPPSPQEVGDIGEPTWGIVHRKGDIVFFSPAKSRSPPWRFAASSKLGSSRLAVMLKISKKPLQNDLQCLSSLTAVAQSRERSSASDVVLFLRGLRPVGDRSAKPECRARGAVPSCSRRGAMPGQAWLLSSAA